MRRRCSANKDSNQAVPACTQLEKLVVCILGNAVCDQGAAMRLRLLQLLVRLINHGWPVDCAVQSTNASNTFARAAPQGPRSKQRIAIEQICSNIAQAVRTLQV